MNFRLKTRVNGYYEDVMRLFDQELFEALLPKFGRVKIVAFTGSKTGDRVHLRFLSPVRFDWISDITEDGKDHEKAWFVDEGRKLPPGLSFWRHKHIVRRIDDQHSEIIDDITFKGTNPLLTVGLYPAIVIGFLPRKKVYKNYFKRKAYGNS